MIDFVALPNIQPILARELILPTVVMWNRLEGRPRRKDFDRALRAEVRDALWMLTRQWQVGEFRGDDAGSPVYARLLAQVEALKSFQSATGAPVPFDDSIPLETRVEERPIVFSTREHLAALDLRLLMGRQWLKMIAPIGNFRTAFIGEFPIERPEPLERADAQAAAHVDVWQHFSAVAGRAMDGAALYFYLKGDATRHAYDDIIVPETAKPDIDDAATKFLAWFDSLFVQPNGQGDSWLPSQLEYQFSLDTTGAPGKVLRAREYYHGRLDWFNLDIDGSTSSLNGEVPEPAPVNGDTGPPDILTAFFPTALTFDGMPNTRWWTFEEGRTNFGDIKPDTNELGKLLLMEFGLVYANDWFLVPLTVPAGSLITVNGLAVSNVFGERIWIEPAGRGAENAWQKWRMFGLSTQNSTPGSTVAQADLSLVMLPTVGKVLEERPLEEIALVRDEVANMVWGIENMVPMPDGMAKRGREAAIELRQHFVRIVQHESETLPPPPPVEFKAPVRYEIMNTVPGNWIPFIPVHLDNDNRQIQLQRASMLRIIENDPNPAKIKPRTSLLRFGLDDTTVLPYFLHEEEVPRTGVAVSQSFQRTRWYGGKVFTWVGVRKSTGRGEGSSGLAFDQLRPTAK